MIINRNMKKYILQEKKKSQFKSGQWKEEWVDVKDIEVAIYPANYTILTSNNIKYSESTNTGLTTEKNIEEVANRIVKKDVDKITEIYEITFANLIGRYTQLYLKQVIYDD